MDSTRLSAQRPQGLPQDVEFAIPWNHKADLIQALDRRQGRFARVFAPLPPWVTSTGRVWAGTDSKESYRKEMQGLYEASSQWGTGVTLLANRPAFPVNIPELIREAHWAAERAPKIRIIFSDLFVAEKAVPDLQGIEIGVSCNAEVKTPMQAYLWKTLARADVITVARSIGRNVAALQAIKNVGVDLSVVLCELGIPNCPFLSYHYPSAPVEDSPEHCIQHYIHACHPTIMALKRDFPYVVAPQEPLPGHMRHYAGLVSEFKIPGRDTVTEEIIQKFDLYWEAESLRHPFFPYSEPPEAWFKLASWDRNCTICDYCGRTMIRHDLGDRPTILPDTASGPPLPVREWRFQRPDGASVTIRCAEQGPHTPVRRVAGFPLEYLNLSLADRAEVLPLIHAMADLLESVGYHPEGHAPFVLPLQPWPGGFVRID